MGEMVRHWLRIRDAGAWVWNREGGHWDWHYDRLPDDIVVEHAVW